MNEKILNGFRENHEKFNNLWKHVVEHIHSEIGFSCFEVPSHFGGKRFCFHKFPSSETFFVMEISGNGFFSFMRGHKLRDSALNYKPESYFYLHEETGLLQLQNAIMKAKSHL